MEATPEASAQPPGKARWSEEHLDLPPPVDGYETREEAILDGLREIEDLAIVELPDGTRYVDRRKLYAIQREQAQRCREVLGPFIEWLIRRRGMTGADADSMARRVYRGMWASRGKPLAWVGEPVARFEKTRLRIGSLSAYATYLTEQGNDSDKEWARRLILGLSAVRLRPRLNDNAKQPKGPTSALPIPKAEEPQPYSDAERTEILAALERWHRRNGARCPWLRPITRVHWLGCPFALPEGIARVEREMVLAVLRELGHNKAATLPIWTPRGRLVLIAGLVKPELEDLANWPAPWGTLADLIQPASRRKKIHFSAAGRFLNKKQGELLPEARIGAETSWHRWRATMKKLAWDRYHDWTLLAAYTGSALSDLRDLSYLRGEADGTILIEGAPPRKAKEK